VSLPVAPRSSQSSSTTNRFRRTYKDVHDDHQHDQPSRGNADRVDGDPHAVAA
jgi:hypothetical protein